MTKPNTAGPTKSQGGVLPGTPAGEPGKGPGIVPGTPDQKSGQGTPKPRRG
jgi:hypothetical protein